MAGYAAKRRFELAGAAWLVAGVYLMLLGNNGGFRAGGSVDPRLLTSRVTFLGLTVIVCIERWPRND